MFGRDFENYKDDEPVIEEQPVAVKAVRDDPTKFTAKKGKAAAKAVKMKYQFQISTYLQVKHLP
jgi:leucyl-tRNA synthetase